MEESSFYQSRRWKRLRKSALRRDGYRCQESARYGKDAEAQVVHHIYPVEDYPQYAYCLWNLISLSKKRHNEMHDRTTNRLTAAGIALQRRTKIPSCRGSPPLLSGRK